MPEFNTYVNGYFNDFNADADIFQVERVRVTYSANPIGKTLTVSADNRNIQMTIPFDDILEMINNM